MSDDAERRATIDLSGANTSDVRIDSASGRDVYNYHGLPARQVLTLIAEMLGDERQWRRLDSTIREQRIATLDSDLAQLRAQLEQGFIAIQDEQRAQRTETRLVLLIVLVLFVGLVLAVLIVLM